MKVTRVEHVGILVRDVEEALPLYELLGLRVSRVEPLSPSGSRIAFLPAGECQIELIAPVRPDSRASKFIQERGEGLYHLCLEVEDLDAAVKELIAAGVKMIDQAPRTGSRGTRIAFIHPDSAHGTLVELVQEV